mgnify:CR=1 FL=1
MAQAEREYAVGRPYVVTTVAKVFGRRVESRYKDTTYVYEYGQIMVRVPNEFIGRRVKVTMIIEPVE